MVPLQFERRRNAADVGQPIRLMQGGRDRMKINVCVWIDGEEFSPEAFQSKLDPNLKGTTEFGTRLRDVVLERDGGYYWRSPELKAADYEDATTKLHDLVAQLRPALLEIRNDGVRVTGEIVSSCYRSEEAHGFSLPHDTMTLFSEVGASLDIDQYYYAEEASAEGHAPIDEIEDMIQAAEDGHPDSQNFLAAKLVHSGKEEALEGALYWYLQAVRRGYVDAMWNAGAMLMDGEGGITNHDLGLRLIKIAAENGQSSACRYIAYCYEEGLQGFEKSPSLASHWTQRPRDMDNYRFFADPFDFEGYLAEKPAKPNSRELLRKE